MTWSLTFADALPARRVPLRNQAHMVNAPMTEYGDVSAERIWENMEIFLRKVVPVAEKAGVFLGMHPDDPMGDTPARSGWTTCRRWKEKSRSPQGTRRWAAFTRSAMRRG